MLTSIFRLFIKTFDFLSPKEGRQQLITSGSFLTVSGSCPFRYVCSPAPLLAVQRGVALPLLATTPWKRGC